MTSSVVECVTWDQEVPGLSFTWETVLSPRVKVQNFLNPEL